MADVDSRLPIRTVANGDVVVEVSNSTGTTINPVEEFAQGSTTSGQNGPLVQGAVTTSNPSYATGNTSPLSLDVNGNLRVITTPGGGTEPVNVAQWGGVATSLGQKASASSVPVVIASDQSDVPVNLDKVGGSAITLGQKTMANSVPVTLASDQGPINVQIGGVTPSPNYFTDVAVASGASNSHSIAGPINLDQIHGSASGEIKVTVAWGTTGSEVTYEVGFTSAANKNFDWTLKDAPNIPSGSSVKVTIKNLDTAAQDTYLTIMTH